jgi:hypothetical protein
VIPQSALAYGSDVILTCSGLSTTNDFASLSPYRAITSRSRPGNSDLRAAEKRMKITPPEARFDANEAAEIAIFCNQYALLAECELDNSFVWRSGADLNNRFNIESARS